MVRQKTPGWTGDTIECHVAMDKIAGYKKGESNNDTLTGISGPLKMSEFRNQKVSEHGIFNGTTT